MLAYEIELCYQGKGEQQPIYELQLKNLEVYF